MLACKISAVRPTSQISCITPKRSTSSIIAGHAGMQRRYLQSDAAHLRRAAANARVGGRRVGKGGTFVVRAGDVEAEDTMELDLKVSGMMCGGCADSVTTALKKLDAVKDVAVDLDTGVVEVEVKVATMIDALELFPGLVSAVTAAGFEAEPMLAGIEMSPDM
mmetsp:Transcript_26964/g.51387  ORF Transcript_26964/g.51387 Transcript_26964/m.51387 type:complete len:163 (-) Transcript_26964:281-769(-)